MIVILLGCLISLQFDPLIHTKHSIYLLFSSMVHYYRTLEQVHTIAELAKLDLSDLSPKCQCLYFGSDLNAADMVLMEVENSILKSLEEGKR